MTSEHPADPPKSEAKESKTADLPGQSKAEVEYDDFGLPVRKRRPRTPVEDSSDTDEDQFEDAVASKSASRVEVTLEQGAQGTGKDEGKESIDQAPEATSKTAAEGSNSPLRVNGRVKEKVQKIEAKVGQEGEERIPMPKGGKDVVEEKGPDEKGVVNDNDNTSIQASQDVSASTQQSEAVDEPAVAKQEEVQSTQQPEPAEERKSAEAPSAHRHQTSVVSISEYSHQRAVIQPPKEEKEEDEGEWQTMPAYAHYDMYDDDNRLIAKENAEELEDMSGYGNVGGAAKGYTRVIMDDDADSQTSMDDNTAYLFKEKSTALHDDDEEARDPLTQMQTTKNLLTEGQRVAYVGLVRLAMVEMEHKFSRIEKTRRVKKILELQADTTKMWSQKVMVRLYGHMDISASEQVMIEQLSDHGVVAADLTPALMANARVKNPAAEETGSPNDPDSKRPSVSSPRPESISKSSLSLDLPDQRQSPPPPPYEEHQSDDYPDVKIPSQLPTSKNLDIDLRWTVLCDLFLVLIADGVYDARSRELFEQVGKYLSVDWLEICRFEKRVTDALEMQEQADKENWNEDDHMISRAKRARNRRLAFMGLATVGGGLVIGLSAGLLAPLIGAGLAAGFTTVGVAGTGSFLAGAGGAAIITSTGIVTGSTVGVRAANRRTGAVKTFEYRPLHNNKRTHLIITLAGWMTGKVDDVRLPYSTVDPVMGDIYSVLWEPEMLRSMGATINILATEVSI